MTPERAGIPVVQVRHGFAQPFRQMIANIEPGPIRMNKISGSALAQHTARARGTRSIQTDDDNIVELHTRLIDSDPQAIGNLLKANLRGLPSIAPDARTIPQSGTAHRHRRSYS